MKNHNLVKMKRLLLLGVLALFAFAASAQSDTKTCSEKEKTEKVCANTGKKCSETCANKKTDSCCEGKKDSDKKTYSSKDTDKKSCCSKDGDKKSCSKDGDKSSCSKTTTNSGDSTQSKGDKTKGAKKTKTKTVTMSK